MRDQYVSEGDGFIFVFALNSRDSFEALTDFFELVERVRDMPVREVPIVLVGNKADIDESEWEVSRSEAELFATQMGCSFQMTSAATHAGIDQVFKQFVKRVMNDRKKEEEKKSPQDAKQKKKLNKACAIL